MLQGPAGVRLVLQGPAGVRLVGRHPRCDSCPWLAFPLCLILEVGSLVEVGLPRRGALRLIFEVGFLVEVGFPRRVDLGWALDD